MATEIPKTYDPRQVEDRLYRFWLERNYFHAVPNPEKKPYTIVIPPPNVTDRLHMGHAYNNMLQDILIRFKKMQGYEAMWMPGTDHAGIATQNAVEKHLARTEGLTRHDLGREKFVERVWQWKEEHGKIITDQLKKIGCACDWERESFTMDERLSKAVLEVFVRLYNKGLVYRGEYIINWCPRCQTALSDEEVEYEDQNGHLWYLTYPVEDGDGHIIVATTRPETMLGDVAVAVNPEDPRYKNLIGKNLILPIMNRRIPVIADEYVDSEFGTGAVKITPAHDPNDFEIGRRHGLEPINVMNEDGTMSERAGTFAGQDRFEARKGVVAEFERLGLLKKVENYQNSIGHCYRCQTVIEPYLSKQWFVKTAPLAEPAAEVVRDGRVQIRPERWKKVYMHWMENIRDWCISRQLWWGHRIPVYYCTACDFETASTTAVTECPNCGSPARQDPDVLDTWFSSQLWPFSTLGWPEETEELNYFYPTNTLITGHEIIFFWVARMVMAGLEFCGEVPFHDVYLHGIIRDAEGRKMSKSLGNGIDPLQMIEKYSADAMRFSLLSLSSEGQDINLSEKDFEIGRNFANKLWNSFRFLGLNLDEALIKNATLETLSARREAGQLDLADRWILSRYSAAVKKATTALETFRFHEYVDTLYSFFWREYCDWYLELIKTNLYGEDEQARENSLLTAAFVLRGILRLLHPLIPFITEEIWQRVGTDLSESIMISDWPEAEAVFTDEQAESDLGLIRDFIVAVRTIRSEMNVPPSKQASMLVSGADERTSALLQNAADYFAQLARVESLQAGAELARPKLSATAVVHKMDVFLPLSGLIDIEKEKSRLQKERDRLQKQVAGLERKLANENFTSRAPQEVVEREKAKLQDWKMTLEKIVASLEQLT